MIAENNFWRPTAIATTDSVPDNVISSQVWCQETQVPLSMGSMLTATASPFDIDNESDGNSDNGFLFSAISTTATAYTVLTSCATTYFTQAPSLTMETVLTAADGQVATSVQVTANPWYVPDKTAYIQTSRPTLPGVTPPPATKAKDNAAMRRAGWSGSQMDQAGGAWTTLHSVGVMAAAALWMMAKVAG